MFIKNIALINLKYCLLNALVNSRSILTVLR